MKNDQDKIIREFLTKVGRKGGKARAAKYDKATLSKWAKKGGRPPKKGEPK
jgi:general stress protein YciG